MLFDVVFDYEPPGPDNHTVSQDQWRSFVTDHMRVDVKNLPQGAAYEMLFLFFCNEVVFFGLFCNLVFFHIFVDPYSVNDVKSRPMFLSQLCETQ